MNLLPPAVRNRHIIFKFQFIFLWRLLSCGAATHTIVFLDIVSNQAVRCCRSLSEGAYFYICGCLSSFPFRWFFLMLAWKVHRWVWYWWNHHWGSDVSHVAKSCVFLTSFETMSKANYYTIDIFSPFSGEVHSKDRRKQSVIKSFVSSLSDFWLKMDLHSLQFQAFSCQQRQCHREVMKELWKRWQLPGQNNSSLWDATENKQLIPDWDLYFIHCGDMEAPVDRLTCTIPKSSDKVISKSRPVTLAAPALIMSYPKLF